MSQLIIHYNISYEVQLSWLLLCGEHVNMTAVDSIVDRLVSLTVLQMCICSIVIFLPPATELCVEEVRFKQQ